MKTFLNKLMMPFNELCASEQIAIVNAKLEGRCENFSKTKNIWVSGINNIIVLTDIYRAMSRPKPKKPKKAKRCPYCGFAKFNCQDLLTVGKLNSEIEAQPKETENTKNEVTQEHPTTPNTYGGFSASFYVINNRKPTGQEIFNAGRRSGLNDVEALRKENERLRDALIGLISIVKIHQEATKNRFAWAEIDCAEEALKGGAA